jgi:hypothetical protein
VRINRLVLYDLGWECLLRGTHWIHIKQIRFVYNWLRTLTLPSAQLLRTQTTRFGADLTPVRNASGKTKTQVSQLGRSSFTSALVTHLSLLREFACQRVTYENICPPARVHGRTRELLNEFAENMIPENFIQKRNAVNIFYLDWLISMTTFKASVTHTDCNEKCFQCIQA